MVAAKPELTYDVYWFGAFYVSRLDLISYELSASGQAILESLPEEILVQCCFDDDTPLRKGAVKSNLVDDHFISIASCTKETYQESSAKSLYNFPFDITSLIALGLEAGENFCKKMQKAAQEASKGKKSPEHRQVEQIQDIIKKYERIGSRA